MRKREPKTRKARRRASWPCWASSGPFSTCWSSSLSTSTPPCDSYPPAGGSQLFWTSPWEPRWKNPAWLAADWNQASGMAARRPLGIASDGWDHQKLAGCSPLHRWTRPGSVYACDSDTCTVTPTRARWRTLGKLRQTREGLHGVVFQMELSPLQTAYLPHGHLISFSQRFFVSVHICIGFKGTHSLRLFLYRISQCFWRNSARMCYNLLKSILGDICVVHIYLLW